MADPVQIAKRREDALARIAAAANRLSTSLGIDAPILREHARDRAYLEADRLASLAEWLEQADAAFTASPVADNDTMLPLGVNAPDGASTQEQDNGTENHPRPQRKSKARSGR